MEAEPRQLELDFARGEQLAMIRDARFAETNVSAPLLKLVLRSIDDHGRGRECWPSQKTLAAETGCSIRQLVRAIAILRDDYGVLICQRRRLAGCTAASGNHYRIVWSELALLRAGRQIPRLDQSDTAADQSDICVDQSDIRTDQSDTSGVYQSDTSGVYKRSAQREALKETTTSSLSSSEVEIDQEEVSIDRAMDTHIKAMDVLYPPPRTGRPPAAVRNLLIRASFLAGSIGWLLESAAITRRARPDDTTRYLRGVMKNLYWSALYGREPETDEEKARARGEFDRQLAAVRLPLAEELNAAFRRCVPEKKEPIGGN